MTWAEKEKKWGKPKRGKVYVCKLQSFTSGRIIEEELRWHGGEDGTFRLADDGSEINEMNWDVIEWRLK